MRNRVDPGFDEQPTPGLDSEALDFRAASESFAPFRKPGCCDLATLRLLMDRQSRKVPPVGGMLLDRVESRSIPVRGVQDAQRRYFWAKRGSA